MFSISLRGAPVNMAHTTLLLFRLSTYYKQAGIHFQRKYSLRDFRPSIFTRGKGYSIPDKEFFSCHKMKNMLLYAGCAGNAHGSGEFETILTLIKTMGTIQHPASSKCSAFRAAGGQGAPRPAALLEYRRPPGKQVSRTAFCIP